MGAVNIVNRSEINWKFDEESETLDLSGSNAKIVYPIKTMRFARLNLSNSKFRTGELFNLRRIPLKYLNLAYTGVNSLGRFSNEEIEEISFEGCPIKDLTQLKLTKVKILNIYKAPVNIKTLKGCKYLEEITCSVKQAEELKKILPGTIKYKTQP